MQGQSGSARAWVNAASSAATTVAAVTARSAEVRSRIHWRKTRPKTSTSRLRRGSGGSASPGCGGAPTG